MITLEGKPNPGSYEAWIRGCKCPVIDNAHGEGIPGKLGEFIVTDGCPVHTTEGAEARRTEQGYQVWRYVVGGNNTWIAAKTQADADAHLRERHLHDCLGNYPEGELETDLDQHGFCYGDPEDGEESEPCTLRELVTRSIGLGVLPAILVAEDY